MSSLLYFVIDVFILSLFIYAFELHYGISIFLPTNFTLQKLDKVTFMHICNSLQCHIVWVGVVYSATKTLL